MLCGIDLTSTPIFNTIYEGKNDSVEFRVSIIKAMEFNWLELWGHFGISKP